MCESARRRLGDRNVKETFAKVYLAERRLVNSRDRRSYRARSFARSEFAKNTRYPHKFMLRELVCSPRNSVNTSGRDDVAMSADVAIDFVQRAAC